MGILKRIRSRIGAKYVVAFAVTLLVPFLGYVALMQWTSYRTFRSIERRELASAVTGVTMALDRRAQAQIADTVDSAQWPAVGRALARADREWLRANVTTRLVEHFPVDSAEVFAADGSLLATSGDLDGLVAWGTTAVQSARRADPVSALLVTDGDLRLVTATAVPGRMGGSGPRGVLVVARALDRELLHEIAVLTDSRLVVYVGNLPVAVSHPDAADLAAAPPAGAITSGQTVERSHNSMRFVALKDGLGLSIATLGVAVDESALHKTQDTMGDVSLVGALVVLLCAAVAAILVAAHVTRPLRRLALAAASFEAGEPYEPLDLGRSDELGVLGDAFDDMAAEVERRVSQLSHTVEELTRGISEINNIGETLTHSRDVHGQLRRLAVTIADITTSDYVGVRLLDGERVTLAVLHGHAGGDVHAVTVAEERARLTRTTVHVTTVPPEPENAEDQASPADKDRLSTLLTVPLVEGDRVVGTLTIGARGARVYGQNDRALVTIVASLVAVALQSSEAIARLEDSYLQTVTALARAMEAKDQYTADHADTMAEMALAVGRELDLSVAELREVQYGAVLHDIGKIGVPGAILNKPGRLTDDEFAVIANHTVVGESILAKIDYLLPVARIVRSAHERWDGKGYPDGLLATESPQASRIIFVCDAFHAMTSDRPYRAAMPVNEALAELRAHAGTQFDPAVVQAFIAAWPAVETALRSGDEDSTAGAQPGDAG